MEFPRDIQLAIDLAARDVAKAFSDRYGYTASFGKVFKEARGMLSMAMAQACSKKLAKSWTSAGAGDWTTKHADVATGGVDERALGEAVREWFGTLSDQEKYRAATEVAGYDDSTFAHNIIQKYEGKAPGVLEKEQPGVFELYQKHVVVVPKEKTPDANPKEFEESPPGAR